MDGLVRKRLAKEFAVSAKTVERDGKFAAAVNDLVDNCNLPDATISVGRDKKLKRNETVKPCGSGRVRILRRGCGS